MDRTFLDLLWADAPREEYDALRDAQVARGRDRASAERTHARALALADRLAGHRSREAELAALNETAADLVAIRDLDRVLGAIVRRARQLLRADMTYLSLNDEAEGASYMRVTDGALTQEFGRLRLPLGTGLLGLVAQAGAPYFTEDYSADDRFLHRGFIDEAVEGERIRAILGVPLVLEGEVIGALLAVHRVVRPFPPGEVALLTSFAAHAAVALENARLFEQADAANAELRRRTESVERAAHAHDRLTDALVAGAGVDRVAAVLEEALGAEVRVLDPDGGLLAGAGEAPPGLDAAVDVARRTGRSTRLAGDPDTAGPWVAVAAAGEEHLGTLVVDTRGREPEPAQLRTLERGAVAVALVLLFARTEAEAEERVRGELLVDLLDGGTDEPRLRERARRQGLAVDGTWSVAVTRTDDLRGDARRAARLAGARGGLAGVHEDALVVAVPDDQLARSLGEALAAGVGTEEPTVGVHAAGLGEAYAEARRCHDALVALGRAGEVADPADLGLVRLVLGGGGPEHLGDFLRDTLGPVLAYDTEHGTALVATLDAWFAAGGSPRRTAATLHVHPNTVAQRLDRVTHLLGEGWRDPARALDLQVALRMHRLRGHRRGT
ncbi:helix-turn-helix domain-containing protein [Nocardioides sp. CFH 31398]|uniref:helix-turn-helix domain-containing protein n=1 Tax=Nocardioides sp. CFH 31398 TaxID=2919579 RepID=UPI001F0592CA|nr:helix-turn-helix domain-containing protein [Nocardioides sp. CFH 31398]MCH1865796.1 helix-turn-helix domain-containing protein [Nocardioides sp. CFH 31398]